MPTSRALLWAVSIGLLLALPPVVIALGQPFYIDLVRRIILPAR